MKHTGTTYKIGVDVNGNKVLRIKRGNLRAYRIQTNGNLPLTHRDGLGPWTVDEVANYQKIIVTI